MKNDNIDTKSNSKKFKKPVWFFDLALKIWSIQPEGCPDSKMYNIGPQISEIIVLHRKQVYSQKSRPRVKEISKNVEFAFSTFFGI